MPDVKLVNVSKRFRKIVAVDRVSLSVHDGEYLTLLGPSGCGKTTMLRIVSGLANPDEGEVYVGGRLVNDVPVEERGMGFVFQLFAVFPHMTVWGNVAFGPHALGWSTERIEEECLRVLRMVRLEDRIDAYPNELSFGELQKVGLARAIATGSKILLLDEPMGALDAKVRGELRLELRKLVKDLGLTAIHVTHDQEEAMVVSDRIAVMRKGKIVQVDTPPRLYSHPKNVFLVNFIGEASFLEGTVKNAGGMTLIIEIRGGAIIRASDKSFRIGDRVVVALRPEYVKINAKGNVGLNRLHGRVERTKFVGWFTRVEVRLDNGDLIVVEEPMSNGHDFEVGEDLTLTFRPSDALIYHYPEEGLQKALSLE